MTDNLLILAARCEASAGEDRAIDGDIAEALKLAPEWAVKRGACQPDLFLDNGAGLRARTWFAPKFTASLDAAMTLVPDGWWIAGLSFCPTDFRSEQDREWHVEVAGPVTWAVVDREMGEEPQYECEGGNATTPALALTAACLRTLSNSPEEKEG